MNTELGHFLTICEPWGFGLKEAPPAGHLQHAPDREEDDIQTIPPVRLTANRRRTHRDRTGEAAAAATEVTGLFLIFPAISGHFRPTHSSLPQFLGPLNSFPWSLFANSSPFESYDENKVGRRLDQVFQPPQQLLNQGNGTDEFLVSWAFH